MADLRRRVSNGRKYDVVVFGSTGFTGKLVAEYLALNYPLSEVKWAIAGREEKKLLEQKDHIAKLQPGFADLEVVVADTSQLESLKKMAEQASVVINCVGPYRFFGEQVVHACVDKGADYVDLTGEPAFIRNMIAKFHDQAKSKDLYIIPSCGFDSVGGDVGGYYNLLQSNDSKKVVRMDCYVRTENVMMSNGTWTTLVQSIANYRHDQVSRSRTASSQRSERSRSRFANIPRYSRETHSWIIPLASSDPHVVRRSRDLVTETYNSNLEYSHYISLSSFFVWILVLFVLLTMVILCQFRFGVKLLLSVMSYGSGPSEERRKRSKFSVLHISTQSDGKKTYTLFSGGDPGYQETSKIISECALCLLKDRKQLSRVTGVVTPAAALGQPLLQRLQAAGLQFKRLDGPKFS